MIPVVEAPEPAEFDDTVRQPGLLALQELREPTKAARRPGPKRKHTPDLWTRALPWMRDAYKRTCAFLGLYIHRGSGRDTVDHFIPRNGPRGNLDLAYEWSNFRYASLDVNRLKGTQPFVDPFTIQEGWFGLDLMTFEVFARAAIPTGEGAAWAHTVKVLNEPTFCEARRWYHERYWGQKLDPYDPDEPMPLSTLLVMAPFVAAELRRQGRLRPEDSAT